MQEALPGVPKAKRERAGDLIKTTLSTVGQRFSERPRSAEEIDAYVDALADMFCAYVGSPRKLP